MGSLATDPELATRVLSFTSVLRFESRDTERDRDRYYDILWQPSFWGDGALVCVWGRRGQPGTVRSQSYPSRDHALPAVLVLVRRRLQHGYVLVAWQ